LSKPDAFADGGLGFWAYVLLAVLVMVEGPIATLVGALAASAGFLRPGYVFVSAAIGNLTADTIWYSLGYFGKTRWLEQRVRFLGVTPAHVDFLKGEMQRHARKILLAAKLTLSFSIPALIAAGMARVPWRRWFTTVAFGESIWTGSLVVLGFTFRESIKQLRLDLQLVSIVGALAFVAIAVRFALKAARRWQELPLATQLPVDQGEPVASSRDTESR
jgi:membrane protein DedA with SNARE-associated domain